MSWIIRNAQREICGRFTNRPGPGNKLPDDSVEVVQYVEDDPKGPGYNAALIQETVDFRAMQDAKIALAEKRAAALAAIEAQRLAEASADPDAPQAVKDYAAAKAAAGG